MESPIQNLGDIYFLSPVARSDRSMALRKVHNLFSSASYYHCINPLSKSSIMCRSLWHWGFRFGVFSSITMFSQRNFHVLVIHYLVVHLMIDGKLLENRGPDKPISSLWDSMYSLR